MDIRLRLTIVGLVGLLVVAVWMFPTWYPLLNQGTMSNPYPGLEQSAWMDYNALPGNVKEALRQMRVGNDDRDIKPQPETALALVRARLMETDTAAPEDEATFTPPEGSTVDAKATFITIDVLRGASGDVTVYLQPDQKRVLRIENFSSSRAPDVHLIFTSNPDPTDERGVGVNYIDVGTLKANTGNQTYAVPDGVDFSIYPILALYSVKYNLVISTATLG